MTFEAYAIQYDIDSLKGGMVTFHDVATHALSLQRFALAADFKLVRELFSVSDAN